MSITASIASGSLNGLTPITVTLTNSSASDVDVTLYSAAMDNKSPTGIPNSQGGEAVAEAWLEVSDDAGTNWYPLGFPATFPAAFADLTSNSKTVTVPGSGTLDVLVRHNIPAGASSSGIVSQLLNGRFVP